LGPGRHLGRRGWVAGRRPPLYIHRVDEAYYLLEGELEGLDGERTFTANAGPVFTFPRDAVRLEEHNDESSHRLPHRRTSRDI
jgi:mannose-6-phosphate isomerase-like protein (cupin superfamily)